MLTLEDIDWRRGEITVRGKGDRHERLPLPADVGEGVTAYLSGFRPAATAGREVFLGTLAAERLSRLRLLARVRHTRRPGGRVGLATAGRVVARTLGAASRSLHRASGGRAAAR